MKVDAVMNLSHAQLMRLRAIVIESMEKADGEWALDALINEIYELQAQLGQRN